MAKGHLGRVINHLRGLAGDRAGEATDGQLLARFAALREEAAFAALVNRHGGLVLGLCRRILRDHHDAEDAFQAAFLVLAKKAGSIRKRESVGSWLYGVAFRIAVKARADALRRRGHERAAVPRAAADPVADLVGRELRPVLDEELSRLPDKYRAPVVLCYLENMTNAEAARRLGWTRGTVAGRLARARELLRTRLGRRGLTLGGGMLAATLAQQARAYVPALLGARTIKAAALAAAGRAAAAVVAPSVAAMVQGVIQAMVLSKLKIAAAIVLTVALLGTGAVRFADQALGQGPAGVQEGRTDKLRGPSADDKNGADDEIARLRKENERLRKELAAIRKQLEELKRLGRAEADRAEVERRRAEELRRRADVERRRAEDQRRQAEADADAARKQSEKAKREADQLRRLAEEQLARAKAAAEEAEAAENKAREAAAKALEEARRRKQQEEKSKKDQKPPQ
jgi:RNA polymerase sigma factor (sigma-70 family)